MEVPEELNLIPPAEKGIAFTIFAFNTSVIMVCGIWLYLHRASSLDNQS